MTDASTASAIGGFTVTGGEITGVRNGNDYVVTPSCRGPVPRVKFCSVQE